MFDPGGNLDLSTLEDGHDSRKNHFEERKYYENPSMTRNLNPIRIEDNNESPSTTRNPCLTMIQEITRNPCPTRIQNIARNCSPTRTEDPLTYDASPIKWECAKKMKEALHVLIQAIWAQSTNLNNSGVHGVHSGLKLIRLVRI